MFAFLLRYIRRRGLVPTMSETERIALDAGTTWIDADFFSGNPDFARISREAYPELTGREREFLDTEVEEVCALVDDWEMDSTRDLPSPVWEILKRNRFFGLTIPRKYGGHEFSSLACSTIFGRLASRSLPLSAIVLIPNSVGPAELLLHYGTEAQREFYLPRLARGQELPCFALTEPEAGSDAASLQSEGVVFRDRNDELRIRLSWNKRYITLAPVATLIGLAVRLRDPQNLLGRGEDLGITCVLVPASTPGVEIGARHDPMGVPFPNGPTTGRDVIVSADQIIGGIDYAGGGWKMLMESLSAGRSISLPAQSVGGAKLLARITGAYSVVRRQFGTSIGRFEGIEEPLARIAGLTYMMDAARVFTCGAVDRGVKPSVISAIVKYQQTELLRKIANDAMDVFGGAGISRGPRNIVSNAYIGAPIGITVEGANILTRTLITFGQGAIRCHPHARAEMNAIAQNDPAALRRALVSHTLFVTRNALRVSWLNLTRGGLTSPAGNRHTRRWYRKLRWTAAIFALLTDVAMLKFQAKLKTKGKLSGRFADLLSMLYFATATLRRFEAEGSQVDDLPLMEWSVRYCLTESQKAIEGILENLGFPFRFPLAALSRFNRLASPPDDELTARVADAIRTASPVRDRLTGDVHIPAEAQSPVNQLERALKLATETLPVEVKIRRAVKSGALPRADLTAAEAAGVVTSAEASLVRELDELRAQIIAVDSFSPEEYFRLARALNTAAAES